MPTTAQELYTQIVRTLSLNERLRLANLILNGLVQEDVAIIAQNDTWTEEDLPEITSFSLQHAATLFLDSQESYQVGRAFLNS